MRVWTVSYTAKRKHSFYESQRMIVSVTQKEYESAFGPVPQVWLDQSTIEQLAVEKGEALLDAGPWERSPGALIENLDESGFEVEESDSAHYEMDVNVGRKRSTPVWSHLVEDDDGTPCVWQDVSEARAFIMNDPRDLRLIRVDGENRETVWRS